MVLSVKSIRHYSIILPVIIVPRIFSAPAKRIYNVDSEAIFYTFYAAKILDISTYTYIGLIRAFFVQYFMVSWFCSTVLLRQRKF